MNKRGFIETGHYGENNPPVGQGEKPRQTEAQAAQVSFCKQLMLEGQDEAFLRGHGLRGRRNQASKGAEQVSKSNKDDQHIAQTCADKIRDYWAERGHKIKVTALYLPSDNGRNALWTIKSNMVDGLPRSMKKGAAQ